MADDADKAGPRIDDVISDGRARARRALENPSLRPIIQELDGVRFGVCHFCESPIQPGHLFCPVDTIEPEHSCSVLWEHTRKRKEDMGL